MIIRTRRSRKTRRRKWGDIHDDNEEKRIGGATNTGELQYTGGIEGWQKQQHMVESAGGKIRAWATEQKLEQRKDGGDMHEEKKK